MVFPEPPVGAVKDAVRVVIEGARVNDAASREVQNQDRHAPVKIAWFDRGNDAHPCAAGIEPQFALFELRLEDGIIESGFFLGSRPR